MPVDKILSQGQNFGLEYLMTDILFYYDCLQRRVFARCVTQKTRSKIERKKGWE